MGLPHLKHGFHEIISIKAKDPGNTDDKVLIQQGRYREFSVKLTLAIHIERIIFFTVRVPWSGSFAIKT